MNKISAFAVVTILVAVGTVARAATFDFESVPTGYYAGSLSVTNSGLTMTATPEGFPNGWLVVDTSSVPALLGTRSLGGSQVNPFQANSFAPLRLTFDKPIADITFAFGDSGGDNDSPVTIEAFNAANTLLGTINDTYPVGFGLGKTNGFAGLPGAMYFILTSGVLGENKDSIHWEVPLVTPVPEPSSIALAAVALVGLIALCRRNQS